MKRTRLQLHITPNEIMALANSIKNEFDLYMVVMNYNPFFVQEKQSISLNDIAENDCRILFSQTLPFLEANTSLQFINNNKCFMGIEVGKNSSTELEESSIFCVVESETELKISNRILNRLKKQIQKGAVINNPNIQTKHLSTNHKFTLGAKQLYDTGVKMSSIGGGIYYELGADLDKVGFIDCVERQPTQC